MTQELHLLLPKFTFGEFSINVMLTQFFENRPQMLCMLFLGLGVDEDVVNENDKKNLSKYSMKT
jgi:hypothetical protein